MHPAYSIIFFTTASGAGYGLLALLAVFGVGGSIEPAPWPGVAGFGLGFGLITTGLLSSTFHLGHPERAWRAFSQWRSSWLSREGVLSLATFPPALVYAYGWIVAGEARHAWAVAGVATVLLAVLTVGCTAMIYASLQPIRAWRNGWVLPVYFVLALATGAVLLQALLAAFGMPSSAVGVLALASLLAGWVVKSFYWRFLDGGTAASTPESATGLGALGRVRPLDPPNTEENYVQREMGYRVARKHAAKLRRIAVACTFALPSILTLAVLVFGGAVATVAALAAVPIAALGVVIERWLFFAEAKHTVMLYYGAGEA